MSAESNHPAAGKAGIASWFAFGIAGPACLSRSLAYRTLMNSVVDQTEDRTIDSRMPLWLANHCQCFRDGRLGVTVSSGFRPSDWVRPIGWLFWTLASELNAPCCSALVLLNLSDYANDMPKYAVALSLTAAPLDY